MLKLLDKLTTRFSRTPISGMRIALALVIAILADFLQVVLLPLEWIFIQQIIDVVAMALTTLVLGFHPLLLPTFVVELIPLADMLPTWTGCVVAVIALRKRAQWKSTSIQSETFADEKPLPEKIARRTEPET